TRGEGERRNLASLWKRRKGTDRRVNLRLRAMAAMLVFFPQRVVSAEAAAVQAGARLSAGRPADAEAAVTGCPSAECRLVLARALFAQGRLKEAASSVGGAGELGPLAAYGEVLRGEALLLSGSPLEAVEPLRVASTSDGPPSLRASALLAHALLTVCSSASPRRMPQ